MVIFIFTRLPKSSVSGLSKSIGRLTLSPKSLPESKPSMALPFSSSSSIRR